MLLLRIARGESLGILLEPLSTIRRTTLKACASLYGRTGVATYGSPVTYYLSCLLYQFEFPRLFLAMREIIVMRFIRPGFSPNRWQKYDKCLERQNKFSFFYQKGTGLFLCFINQTMICAILMPC
jgi:hypothetical protein